jgi:NADH:ubiquinone oxidoreductase subunit 3 (subunit A)
MKIKLSILVLIVAHLLPMLGIFMENTWYKYIYIVGVYFIGLLYFAYLYKKDEGDSKI